MIVTIVHVWVKPEHVEDFIRATVENHEQSVLEPGNLRFDVLQSREDPARFVLYEAYASEEAAAAHKSTPHYLSWKVKAAEWMARPREGLPCGVIAPREKGRW
jgi:autoinducer 2-degrading protein